MIRIRHYIFASKLPQKLSFLFSWCVERFVKYNDSNIMFHATRFLSCNCSIFLSFCFLASVCPVACLAGLSVSLSSYHCSFTLCFTLYLGNLRPYANKVQCISTQSFIPPGTWGKVKALHSITVNAIRNGFISVEITPVSY